MRHSTALAIGLPFGWHCVDTLQDAVPDLTLHFWCLLQHQRLLNLEKQLHLDTRGSQVTAINALAGATADWILLIIPLSQKAAGPTPDMLLCCTAAAQVVEAVVPTAAAAAGALPSPLAPGWSLVLLDLLLLLVLLLCHTSKRVLLFVQPTSCGPQHIPALYPGCWGRDYL